MASNNVPKSRNEAGDQYSKFVGFIYVFNLIVGTGALTMPAAFQEAGWLLSVVIIVLLSFMGFLTLTFMIESMAISNAKIRFYNAVSSDFQNSHSGEYNVNAEEDENRPLLNRPRDKDGASTPSFEITQRVEMGAMASMYFNKIGLLFFHLCIIIYLYGDLSIYAAAVPKSLRDVACTYNNDTSCNSTAGDDDPCWSPDIPVSRNDAYRIFVAAFLVLLGPFVFFNVQKTKYIQIVTSVARWFSFTLMIILAIIRLGQGKGSGNPPVVDLAGVPNLFGVCVYSFMCHHSLPSLITPIKNKNKMMPMLAWNYSMILIFYLILSLTAVFAKGHLDDLYTLSFKPHSCDPFTTIQPFQYFLVLFPVITLSTNFPIIAITLRNNLAAMLSPAHESSQRPFIPKIVCPLLALLPPVAVAMATNKIEFLVGITGSYAGAGIQYVIPAVLVYYARKDILAIGRTYQHRSPFAHKFWVFLSVSWAIICMIFVTVNHIISKK